MIVNSDLTAGSMFVTCETNRSLPCNQNTNENQQMELRYVRGHVCGEPEGISESGHVGIQQWILSSFILAHKVRRQKHRTDRTYKTKWTDCGVRMWTTCQKTAPCAKTDRRKRKHIACSLINIILTNTRCSVKQIQLQHRKQTLRFVISYPVLRHMLRKYRNINDLW